MGVYNRFRNVCPFFIIEFLILSTSIISVPIKKLDEF
jgi:hypothetical protein